MALLSKRTDRLQIHHRAGAGPPIVWLSEHGMSAKNWRVVAADVGADQEWLEVDLAGTGRSSAPRRVRAESSDLDPTDITVQATALYEELVIGRDLPPFLLVGHGFGALVAEQYAAQASDTVLGLVLANPICVRFDEWSAALTNCDVESLTHRPLSAPMRQVAAATCASDRESWAGVGRQLQSLIHSEDASTMRLPVLLIVGDHAPFTPLGRVAAMASQLPAASVCVLNDVGHFPMLEAPKATADAIRRFLPECPGARRGPAPGAWGARPDCVWPDRTGAMEPATADSRPPDEIAEVYWRGHA